MNRRETFRMALVGGFVGGVLVAGAGMASVHAQRRREPAVKAQVQGRVKVIGTARPPRRTEPPNAPEPAALSKVELVRQFKAVLASLAEEQRRIPDLQLGRAFPLGLAEKVDLTMSPMAEPMTSRHPYIGIFASLEYFWPSWVTGNEPRINFYPSLPGEQRRYLEVNLDMVEGTNYLLDFTIDSSTPGAINMMVEFPYGVPEGAATQMEMATVDGHLLLPIRAWRNGGMAVRVLPVNLLITVYSVRISTVE